MRHGISNTPTTSTTETQPGFPSVLRCVVHVASALLFFNGFCPSNEMNTQICCHACQSTSHPLSFTHLLSPHPPPSIRPRHGKAQNGIYGPTDNKQTQRYPSLFQMSFISKVDCLISIAAAAVLFVHSFIFDCLLHWPFNPSIGLSL